MARYLAGTLDLAQKMEMRHNTGKDLVVDVFVDSDWAGITDDGQDARKSTSGCLIFVCGMLVGFHSRTQKQRALSSCEAEFISMASGAQEGLFVKQLVEFIWNRDAKLQLWCDSSSARQLAKKRGPGRIRHLDLRTLFVQDLVEQGVLSVGPISGEKNPADIMTKVLNDKNLRKHYDVIGIAEIPKAEKSKGSFVGVVRNFTVRPFVAVCSLLLTPCSGISQAHTAAVPLTMVGQPDMVSTSIWIAVLMVTWSAITILGVLVAYLLWHRGGGVPRKEGDMTSEGGRIAVCRHGRVYHSNMSCRALEGVDPSNISVFRKCKFCMKEDKCE